MKVVAGYLGGLWHTVYSTLAFYNDELILANTASGDVAPPTTAQLAQLSQAMFNTLANGAEAINAYATSIAWRNEINSMQQIQALPLSLSPTASTIFTNRLTAYESALVDLNGIVPQVPYAAPQSIASGVPSVPSAGLLDYYGQFSYETPPAGLTTDNLITNALSVEDAFNEVAAAISAYQGANITQLYDVAIRQALVAGATASILQQLTSGPFAADVDGLNTWNQIVTVPAFTMCADMLAGTPYTEELQQQAALRNVMLSTAGQVAVYMLTQRQPQTAQVRVTTLLTGESLMDVASRTLGNFEQWIDIAELNGLVPPYVGVNSSPGIAGWGSRLILPTPGAAVSALGVPPSYTVNYLGIDLYIGPINGEMPHWRGDFETILGYSNLRWALGRRIQTTQGSLIYHPQYGSRIPPEVGAVQDNATAGHVAAFGKSAILADPRVERVLSATATLKTGSQIAFVASVQPGGFQTTAIELNEVISRLPGT